MLDASRPILSPAEVRAICAAAADDPDVYARVMLAAVAGARPLEVEGLRVGDYDPAGPRVRLRDMWGRSRRIRIAPSAAVAVEKAMTGDRRDDPLWAPWTPVRLVQLVRATARAAGVTAGVHELRQTAIAIVLEDGTPVHHIEAYFGVGRPKRPVPDGYDWGIAEVLEAAFAA